MATVEITDDNFENTVLKADKFFLLDFWAPWCAPCKMISPVLEELSNEMSSKLTIGKINIDPMKYIVAIVLINASFSKLVDTK